MVLAISFSSAAWFDEGSESKERCKQILSEGDSSQTKELQVKADLLAKRMGLSKAPRVIRHDKYPWKANGVDYRSSGNGVITVDRKVFDPETVDFYLKGSQIFTLTHELAHFDNLDGCIDKGIPSIIAIGFFPFSFSYFMCSYYIILISIEIISIAVMGIALLIIFRVKEKRADLQACKYTSDEEKLARIVKFKFDLINHLKYRNEKGLSFIESLKRKIDFDSSGNYRRDLTHPPITERIRYIQEAMKNKPENIDPEAFLQKCKMNLKKPVEPEKRIWNEFLWFGIGASATFIGGTAFKMIKHLDLPSKLESGTQIEGGLQLTSLAIVAFGYGTMGINGIRRLIKDIRATY